MSTPAPKPPPHSLMIPRLTVASLVAHRLGEAIVADFTLANGDVRTYSEQSYRAMIWSPAYGYGARPGDVDIWDASGKAYRVARECLCAWAASREAIRDEDLTALECAVREFEIS